mmetsp:Transcript_7259/g.17557  ORF Transcript_7259/g.17557 Transcript_7259/m.17557 type:complete len:308 (-) Transcript_7259:804-1727(-)
MSTTTGSGTWPCSLKVMAKSSRRTPSTRSITIAECPVKPISSAEMKRRTRTTFGWLIRAKFEASLCDRSPMLSLTAISSPPSFSTALQTSPCPPHPSFLIKVYPSSSKGTDGAKLLPSLAPDPSAESDPDALLRCAGRVACALMSVSRVSDRGTEPLTQTWAAGGETLTCSDSDGTDLSGKSRSSATWSTDADSCSNRLRETEVCCRPPAAPEVSGLVALSSAATCATTMPKPWIAFPVVVSGWVPETLSERQYVVPPGNRKSLNPNFLTARRNAACLRSSVRKTHKEKRVNLNDDAKLPRTLPLKT